MTSTREIAAQIVAKPYWPLAHRHEEAALVDAIAAALDTQADALSRLSRSAEWRDIASAPKDGTFVLLFVRGSDAWCPSIGRWNGDAWGDEMFSFHLPGLNMPTHWQPLPAPPLASAPPAPEEPRLGVWEREDYERLKRGEGMIEQEIAVQVITEISVERERQISAEGWSAEHDDQHKDRSMAKAAAAYCQSAANPGTYQTGPQAAIDFPLIWPSGWSRRWWKPKDPRRDLIRAAALIVAEIERLDRLTAGEEGKG
jgi:hypothetical protein